MSRFSASNNQNTAYNEFRNSPLFSILTGEGSESSYGVAEMPAEMSSERVQLVTLLSMLRLSWRYDSKGEFYSQYDEMVQALAVALNDERLKLRLKRLCDIENPALFAYAQRVFRSVSAQRSVAKGVRQINFGIGLMPGASVSVNGTQLVAAAQELESSLSLMWRDFKVQVAISPIPLMLETIVEQEELSSHSRFESVLEPNRFEDVSRVSRNLPLVSQLPYVLKGVVSVSEANASTFISESLMPQAPSPELIRMKQRVEVIMDSATTGASITPPYEAGNLPSIVRFMQFRHAVTQALLQSGDLVNWAVTYMDGKIRMVNFVSRKKLEFFFPEEPEAQVKAYASRVLTQLGLTDLLL